MINLAERFQILHWNDVAGLMCPFSNLAEDHIMKSNSTFNSFILHEALKEIYQKHPGIDTYEGATDIHLELWEPKGDEFSRLVIRVGGYGYIIAPKKPSE